MAEHSKLTSISFFRCFRSIGPVSSFIIVSSVIVVVVIVVVGVGATIIMIVANADTAVLQL